MSHSFCAEKTDGIYQARADPAFEPAFSRKPLNDPKSSMYGILAHMYPLKARKVLFHPGDAILKQEWRMRIEAAGNT